MGELKNRAKNMAKIESLIPFILHFEAGVKKEHLNKPIGELFAIAKKTGWADDPLDKGGATMCGVTLATYRAYRKKLGYNTTGKNDLKNIPYVHWREILKQMYWDKWRADEINNQSLANILVDWVWASGVHGIKIPQRILGLTADGIVGKQTISAVNAREAEVLFDVIHDERIKFVEGIVRRNPSQAKWLNGWKRRINAITFEGLKY